MKHRLPHAQLILDNHALLKRTAHIERRLVRDYILAAAAAAAKVRIETDKMIDLIKIGGDKTLRFEVMLQEELKFLPAMLRCARIRHHPK